MKMLGIFLLVFGLTLLAVGLVSLMRSRDSTLRVDGKAPPQSPEKAEHGQPG